MVGWWAWWAHVAFCKWVKIYYVLCRMFVVITRIEGWTPCRQVGFYSLNGNIFNECEGKVEMLLKVDKQQDFRTNRIMLESMVSA